jgi:hypothetical protein
VARKVRAWEYLFGGLAFAGAGLAAILGSALGYSTQVPQPGIALFLVEVCFGALILGIGGYLLWKFDQVRRQEAKTLSSRLPAQ